MIPHEGSDNWVEDDIKAAKDLLLRKTPPVAADGSRDLGTTERSQKAYARK